MKQPKRRAGRPTKTPKRGERMSLGLRVTRDIKMALDGAAKESGRSQSQEAEARLERTFRDDEIMTKLDEVLSELRKWRPA